MPKYIPAIHGHPEFNWDQELLLQLAFAQLDKGRKGGLTLEDVSHISHTIEVHSLLQFTVFWSFIKKKQWTFFLDMFGPLKGPSPGTSRRNDHEGEGECVTKTYLTYSDWLGAAGRISREKAVPIRHIRSQEEHIALNAPLLSKPPPSSSMSTAAKDVYTTNLNAAKVYLNRKSFERECYMSRQIAVGDSVWALHNCGVLWLPAVVERIYTPSLSKGRSSTPNGGAYVCDLWFPLTQKELTHSRLANDSKALVQLPSSQRRMMAHNEILEKEKKEKTVDEAGRGKIRMDSFSAGSVLLFPKPFESERAACAYAFDLVDSEAKGIVELSKLVRCFCEQREFQRVVENVSALSILFAEERKKAFADSDDPSDDSSSSFVTRTSRMDHETIPSLLPVFIDTFSGQQTEDETEGDSDAAGKDWISKVDFLEFCQAVIDIKMYSIVGTSSDPTFAPTAADFAVQ